MPVKMAQDEYIARNLMLKIEKINMSSPFFHSKINCLPLSVNGGEGGVRPEWAGPKMDRVAAIMHTNCEMLGCEKWCDRSCEFVTKIVFSHNERLMAPGLNVS